MIKIKKNGRKVHLFDYKLQYMLADSMSKKRVEMQNRKSFL